MRNGVRIGRLFGINIYVDPSWLLIFLLVTWNLASGFAFEFPNWPEAARDLCQRWRESRDG